MIEVKASDNPDPVPQDSFHNGQEGATFIRLLLGRQEAVRARPLGFRLPHSQSSLCIQ